MLPPVCSYLYAVFLDLSGKFVSTISLFHSVLSTVKSWTVMGAPGVGSPWTRHDQSHSYCEAALLLQLVAQSAWVGCLRGSTWRLSDLRTRPSQIPTASCKHLKHTTCLCNCGEKSAVHNQNTLLYADLLLRAV